MSSVGQTLIRAKKKKMKEAKAHYQNVLQIEAELSRGVREQEEPQKLKSIWETTNMDDFLAIADNRENGYMAERNVRVVVGGAVHIVAGERIMPQSDNRDWFKLSEQLTIPKRPEWDYKMTSNEIQQQEKIEFLNWRRSLASLEESNKTVMTPYEKNLEVWRQLWRVVERSDIVLEILDARNPLAFRCLDFERYTAGFKNKAGKSKQVVLLLNKADLLTEHQRKVWASFLEDKGLKFYFFSAKPLEIPSGNTRDEEDAEVPNVASDDDDANVLTDDEGGNDEEDEVTKAALQKLTRNRKEKGQRRKLAGAPVKFSNPYAFVAMQKAMKEAAKLPKEKISKPQTASEAARNKRVEEKIAQHKLWELMDPEDLLDHLAYERKAMGIEDVDTPLMVGMVGYPNVGKSSTINAIIGCKKVVVSATPGKTKHFQTLTIPEERRLMLCDCPGLVFPSFAATRETMVCDGILPIDTVKDYVTPVAVICKRIPRRVLEMTFRVTLEQSKDVDENISLADRLLCVVARRKGYMTEHDKPNRSRIAKELLKMYVDGALVYVHPPPAISIPIPQHVQDSLEKDKQERLDARHRAHGDDVAAGPSTRKSERKEGEHGGEDEEWEDADDEEEEDEELWEDVNSADEARALSDDEGEDEDDEEDQGPDLRFFHNNEQNPNEFALGRDELFNIEVSLAANLAAKSQIKAQKKRKLNRMIEPIPHPTITTEEGKVEVLIDSDDGIVEYTNEETAKPNLILPDSSSPKGPLQQRKKSKRSQRREMKKAGIDVPANPTTRVLNAALLGASK